MDCESLEEEVMSANRFSEKRITLIVVAALAFVSFVAIGSFAMREVPAQESAERQAREVAERKKEIGEYRNYIEKETLELRQALERETNPEIREKLEARLRERERGFAMGVKEARRFDEFRGEGLAAAKWAKIPMDQAIQVAVSQNPGTVLRCELLGDREDKVIYHVMVINGDEINWAIAHVFVSAIDGTIVKTEKELPKKQRPE